MNCYHYVGHCPRCKGLYEFLNIRRGHWAYCDTCRVKEYLGEDLYPYWRLEKESIWQENAEKIEHYTDMTPRERTLSRAGAQGAAGKGK